MQAATKILIPLAALAALPACKDRQADEQNVVITNEIPPDADVEALPPDESSGTSTNELINGADNPDVNGDINAPDNQTDSY